MNDTFSKRNVVLLTDADVDRDITEAGDYVGFPYRENLGYENTCIS